MTVFEITEQQAVESINTIFQVGFYIDMNQNKELGADLEFVGPFPDKQTAEEALHSAMANI